MTTIVTPVEGAPNWQSGGISDHNRMHADHLQWFSENSLWRDDVAMWQKELENAIQQLSSLREGLEKNKEMLCQHAASIRMREQNQAAHECALAQFEQGGAGQELIGMATGHQKEATKQVEQRECHEKLKRRHHALIARFNTLVDSVKSTIDL